VELFHVNFNLSPTICVLKPFGIEGDVLDNLLMKIEEKVKEVDAIIISDYAKGVITKEVIDVIRSLAYKEKKIVAVDPQVRHFMSYEGLTLMTPNKKEASEGIGMAINTERELEEVGREILERLRLDYLLITLGKDGIALFKPNERMKRVPTAARNVYDVTGAGDTVISALTLALVGGASIEEASVIANYAAGIVVGYVGTAICSKAELINTIMLG
jgi:rfaE bifunctional protein kinase chain/domain